MAAILIRMLRGMVGSSLAIAAGMVLVLCLAAHAQPWQIPLVTLGGICALAAGFAIPSAVLIARREDPDWNLSQYSLFSLFATGGSILLAGSCYSAFSSAPSLSFDVAVIFASIICGGYAGIAHRMFAGKMKVVSQ